MYLNSLKSSKKDCSRSFYVNKWFGSVFHWQSQSSSRRPIRFCKASPPSPSGKPSDLSNGHTLDPPNALSNGHAPSAQSLSNDEGSGGGGTVLENGVLQTGKLELNGDLDKEEKVNGEEKKRSSRVNQCASFIPNEPAADELESENEKIGRKYSYVSINHPVFIVKKNYFDDLCCDGWQTAKIQCQGMKVSGQKWTLKTINLHFRIGWSEIIQIPNETPRPTIVEQKKHSGNVLYLTFF